MKTFQLYFINFKQLLILMLIFLASTASSQEVPKDLKQWQGWIEYQQEFYECPFFYNKNSASPSSHVCAWPQTLDLNISEKGGSFSIQWNIIQDSWVPLPGDKYAWPQNVTINDKDQIVQRQNNRPRIFLKKGNYTIKGIYDWGKRPENIEVPNQIADINLSIDNDPIKFLQRKGSSLWLGENKTQDKKEANEIDIEVNRLIIDGHPMTMYVVLSVSVSGNARSEKLGKISSAQLQVTRIGGELSSYIDNDGYLWAQLKPGVWQVHASFNVLDWPNKMVFEPEGENWPNQE
ncbi:MAG: hypothetical protein AB8B80_11625, partial [Marinicellaceae bacterium]